MQLCTALLGAFLLAILFPLKSLLSLIPIYAERYLIDNIHLVESAELGIGFISKLLIAFILIFFIRDRLIRIDIRYNVAINAFIFYCIFMLLFNDIMVFLRIAYYFQIFLVPILAVMPICFKEDARPIAKVITILYVFLLFYVQMSDETGELIPYKFNMDLLLS